MGQDCQDPSERITWHTIKDLDIHKTCAYLKTLIFQLDVQNSNMIFANFALLKSQVNLSCLF